MAGRGRAGGRVVRACPSPARGAPGEFGVDVEGWGGIKNEIVPSRSREAVHDWPWSLAHYLPRNRCFYGAYDSDASGALGLDTVELHITYWHLFILICDVTSRREI